MIEPLKNQNGTTSYRARFMVGGRLFVSKVLHSRQEAELWEAEQRLKIEAGREIVGARQTFGDFATEWLVHQQANTVKGSWVKERANLNRYLIPEFGRREMRSFQMRDVQQWLNALAVPSSPDIKPVPANKRDDLIRCLKQIFGQAVEWNVISANPLIGLERIRLMKRKVEVYTVDELAQMIVWLFDNIPEIADLALFAVNTGMRLGELVAITWAEIDFRSRTVMVQTQWDAKECKFAERTKGKRVRQVPLNTECIELLTRRKLDPRPDGHVFTGDYYRVTNDWTLWMKDAGLTEALERGCSFHNLRHTFASNFLSDPNNSMYDLQQILGHASITTTERNYLCFDPRHLRGKTDTTGFSVLPRGARVLPFQK